MQNFKIKIRDCKKQDGDIVVSGNIGVIDTIKISFCKKTIKTLLEYLKNKLYLGDYICLSRNQIKN